MAPGNLLRKHRQSPEHDDMLRTCSNPIRPSPVLRLVFLGLIWEDGVEKPQVKAVRLQMSGTVSEAWTLFDLLHPQFLDDFVPARVDVRSWVQVRCHRS
jgi:hypothetical protein